MPIDLDLPAPERPAPERPALIATAPARSTTPGTGLSCLRTWRRARDRGAGDEVREAALLSGPVAPLTPASGT